MKIAVVLSGCGVQDGSEIHEATLTLLFVDRAGAMPVCFGPDTAQTAVVDHLTGRRSRGTRNVLTESARIARGSIQPLSAANPDELDGAILPGGYGAARNLSTFAQDGARCRVDPELERLLRALHAQGKPIGAVCIAPVIVAKLFGAEKPILTIGSDPATAQALEAMGAMHQSATVSEAVVDERLKLVTAPAYMLATRIADAASGIERLVAEVLRMASASSPSLKVAS